MSRIAVCGAGTGVGKTHVACCLVAELVRRGQPAVALKPVESGYTPEQSDAAELARACGQPITAPLYALREPLSPHCAARAMGIEIDIARIAAHVAGDRWIVETAGGLLSPLNPRATNLELIVRLDPDAVVLVVADRLGALHDARACLLALERAGLQSRTLVALSACTRIDASTGTNARELEGLGWARTACCFPQAPLAHADSHAAAAVLADAIAALS